jgi:hypothetical protein
MSYIRQNKDNDNGESERAAKSNTVAQQFSDQRESALLQLQQQQMMAETPLQRMAEGDEEDELLQGKFVAQREGLEDEEEVLQGKFEPAQRAEKVNETGMPDNLKAGIESLSGFSMDHVRVHYNSDKPAQLNAHAYAQGSEIHLAPGQEKHLPHEAWHVVQQMEGRVRPTMQMKGGVQVNDDRGLETEASHMGDQAMSTSIQFVPKPTSINQSNDIVQCFPNLLSYLTGNLSEQNKDDSYFTRSNWNPLNWIARNNNNNYENTNTAYHSTSVHGADNTISNLQARHQPHPGGGNMSQMVNPLSNLQNIRRQNNSSRFASASWERHARNDALAHFNAAAGGHVNWHTSPPPFGAHGSVRTSKFFMSYNNYLGGSYEVGVTSQGVAGGPPMAPMPTNHVQVTINYEQVGPNIFDAWIGQMFPTPAVGLAQNNGPVITANVTPTAWSLWDFTP